MEDDNVVTKIFTTMMNGQSSPTIIQKEKNIWSLLKITIGNLLVRGYRIFKYMLNEQCLIFIKKDEYSSNYLYLKIDLQNNGTLAPNILNSTKNCINKVNEMRKKQQQKYSILILFPINYSTLQFKSCEELHQIIRVNVNNLTYEQLKTKIKEDNYFRENFAIPYTSDEIKIGDNELEQKKLKEILYSYIDTFGQKNKINYYKQLSKKSYYLINTINTLLYEQTKPQYKTSEQRPQYNQIESSCWTEFGKEGLKSDRKDIVLSGSGSILFIDLIFLQSFGQYIDDEYKKQVKDLIFQCKKFYANARVKVIRIDKKLTDENIYRYETKLVMSIKNKLNN